MQLVDTHHHLWCPQTDQHDINYVWLKNIGAIKPFGDPTAIQRDYLIDEFLSESSQHHVTASVHIQVDGAIPNPLNECKWIESIRNNRQFPTAQIGFIDLSSKDAQKTLDQFTQIPGIRGVRQILSRLDHNAELSFASEHYLENKRWRDQFELLSELGMSFELQCYPQQMQDAAEFLSLFPAVPVVIDHAGSPYDQSVIGISQWVNGLKTLSQLPQCQIKLSGFGMFDQQWNALRIQSLFDNILELFSPERVMFGSNYPVDKLMHSYDYIVNQLLNCALNLGLSGAQIEQIFRRTAQRFYRLESEIKLT